MPADALSSPLALKRSRRSGISNVLQPQTFMGTPQSTEPSALLKHQQRKKVQSEMEDRMAKIPRGSPYALLEGENEEGSPRYAFKRVKVEEDNSSPVASASSSTASMSKYLTATPGRAALKSLDNAGARRILQEKRTSIDSAASEKSPRSIDSENVENSFSEPLSNSLIRQPQLYTGELVKACVVM